jgi:hypothetical protein
MKPLSRHVIARSATGRYIGVIDEYAIIGQEKYGPEEIFEN